MLAPSAFLAARQLALTILPDTFAVCRLDVNAASREERGWSCRKSGRLLRRRQGRWRKTSIISPRFVFQTLLASCIVSS